MSSSASSVITSQLAEALPPVYLRSREVYATLGQKLTQRAMHCGWLTPRIRRHGFSIYAIADVQRMQARLLAGEFPPPLACELRAREVAKAKALADAIKRATVEKEGV